MCMFVCVCEGVISEKERELIILRNYTPWLWRLASPQGSSSLGPEAERDRERERETKTGIAVAMAGEKHYKFKKKNPYIQNS